MALHDEYRAMAAAKALDALDQREARAFSEHLNICAECRADVDQLTDVVSVIALSTTPVEPYDGLRDRIVDLIGITAQEPAKVKAAAPATATSAEPVKTPAVTSKEPSKVLSFTPRVEKRSRVAQFLAVAASVAFAAAAVFLVLIWQKDQEKRQEIGRLNANLALVQKELTQEKQISDLLSSPTARIAELKGTEESPQSNGKFVVDMNSGRAVLMANNLRAAPAGKEYQLWYIADGKPMAGGVFKADASGNARKMETVPLAGRTATLFAVTMEPEGGTKAPTSPILLKGPAS